jgi:transcription elongation factor GreA
MTGVPVDGRCGADRMAGTAAVGHGVGMRLTQTDFDALVRELDELRRKHRIELERRLRDARDFGSPADNDDVLTVFEEIAIDQSKIARLEEAVRSVVIVSDDPFDGAAGPGCAVEVTDGCRRTTYQLVARRTSAADRHAVSMASPVGQALVGSRAGDVAHASLPDGRSRRLEVISVSPPVIDDAVTVLRDVVAA